ncbi:hypothetical protein SUGI_0413790 [Cryptomeria japonica]|uniref:uncharacterized protein LOC131069053 isoform X2 n=1 Tax=Cryptomeria japonica TaxID=3369 RepID=UPI002408B73D|nr:uncharacterized protein LOC131069053 isoform X2 [Cryptomeria japonica]GLJ22075.1 hypothetical protein SUGI_0413790 [Cryptomeria japonica]
MFVNQNARSAVKGRAAVMEAHAQEDNMEQIWESRSTSQVLPLGRVMNTVLSAKPKELEAVLSQQTQKLQKNSKSALDQSLTLLRKHVEEIVQRNELLDQVLVPLLEHAVKFRGLQNRKQVLILLQWLSQSEEVFMVLADSLEKILIETDDHHIILGWCIVVRELVENEFTNVKSFIAGTLQGDAVHLFKICCHCIPRLLSIVHEGSVEQDGFLLPRRLSIAVADCILVFTQALTEDTCFPTPVRNKQTNQDKRVKKQLISSIDTDRSSGGVLGNDIPSTSGRGSSTMEKETLLWQHLDNLVDLVQQLKMWSKRSRPLHEKGLQQVFKRLQEMRSFRDSVQVNQDGSESEMKIGKAVLSACWKQYGKLMLLEDRNFTHTFKDSLQHFIAALQHYTHIDDQEEDTTKKQDVMETRSYFLACIALLLGRLDTGLLERTLAEDGPQLLNLLFAQLRHADGDSTDLAVDILRSIIFRSSIALPSNSESSFERMETITPLLIELLDERDSTARAVVLLIAEYFSINPDAQGLKELFARLDSDNPTHRRNALDVISELMAICSQSGHTLASSLSQNIAKHLLDRLCDEELTNRVQASKLFSQLDPSFVLPALVRLVYSSDARVRSAASDALVAVLKGQTDPCNVIGMLLDSVRNTIQSISLPKHPGQVGEQLYPGCSTSDNGPRADVDQIMRLVPKWSIVVHDWDSLVKMLLSKMFAEPSNAIIPRFMSQISDHLADVANIVFRHILPHMLKQQEVNEDTFSKGKEGRWDEGHDARLAEILFDRLSPLLVLRVLPLKAFNDLHSRELYGELFTSIGKHGGQGANIEEDCITVLLINRMSHVYEFDDVRKLAAELTGRLHPQVMLPLIEVSLEHATLSKNMLKLKACLFAICTSLVIRGKETALHAVMVKIRHLITTVLLWPCLDSDEVSKAQHGCIDCLALMICSEFGISDSNVASSQSNKPDMLPMKSRLIEEVRDQADHVTFQSNAAGDTVISAVLCSLTLQQKTVPFIISKEPHSSISEDGQKTSMPLAFRLCMANVLISACQKISHSGKLSLSRTIIPALIDFVQVSDNAQMRAACLQVLFTTVYHLKSSVLSYANDLLSLSIEAVRNRGLPQERIAGAKLMASLMASEESIVKEISPNLMKAKEVLRNISFMDTSTELRSLCEKLLECMSISMEGMIF